MKVSYRLLLLPLLPFILIAAYIYCLSDQKMEDAHV